jgi:hypothetical protein
VLFFDMKRDAAVFIGALHEREMLHALTPAKSLEAVISYLLSSRPRISLTLLCVRPLNNNTLNDTCGHLSGLAAAE